MKKRSGLMKSIIISLCFGIAAFLCLLMVARKANGEYDRKTIAVAVKDIPEGVQITKKNAPEYFVLQKISAELWDENSVEELEGLSGKYTKQEIYAKQTINEKNFTTEKSMTEKYENAIEASFALTAFSDGVAGTIRRGDRIDIYVADIDSQAEEVSLVMEDVLVSGSFDSTGTKIGPGDNASVASVFTIYMEREQENGFYQEISGKTIKITKIN